MTSEEYARRVGKFMLEVARKTDTSTEEYAYRRLFSMAASRIMFEGRDEYAQRGDEKQSVETKPKAALIQDIEEEVTDLVAYASALAMRDGSIREEMQTLVFLALEMMRVTGEVRNEQA
jgi:hypothetical protein